MHTMVLIYTRMYLIYNEYHRQPNLLIIVNVNHAHEFKVGQKKIYVFSVTCQKKIGHGSESLYYFFWKVKKIGFLS